jgi:DNA-binding NarL/FixJ family response regulator
MIRVGIVDQYALLREVLRRSFEAEKDVQVVGEAGSGMEAVELVRRESPDILILETAIPNKDGIDTAKEILRQHGPTQILVLTSESAPHHAYRMLRAGARGFLPKTVGGAEILKAVRAVHGGQVYLHGDLQRIFAEWHLSPQRDSHPEERLSDREYQVMRMLAMGNTNREIAEELVISIKTVDTHRANVLKKLRLRNNADLTRFAIRHSFVAP